MFFEIPAFSSAFELTIVICAPKLIETGLFGAATSSSCRLGKRPSVRGVVMNPVDHPHGGGEGRSSGGRHPVTPWGVPTKGKRTRRKKPSDKYIMRRRHKR